MKCLFMLIVLISLDSYSQDSTLCNFIFPNEGKFEIRLNQEMIHTKNHFNVSQGIHKIEIWNAGITMIQDTITVEGNQPLYFRYPIEIDSNYINYKKSLSKYRMNMFGFCALPTVLSLGLGTGTFFIKRRARLYYEDLESFKLMYPASTDQDFLASYPLEYDQKVKRYNSSRNFYYSALPVTLLSVGVSVFAIYKFIKKFDKPENTFFTSPFTNIDYSFNALGPINTFNLTIHI